MMQDSQNLVKPCGYQCRKLRMVLPTSLTWWEKKNALNESPSQFLHLIYSVHVPSVNQTGHTDNSTDVILSIKPCYCPFQLHTTSLSGSKVLLSQLCCHSILNASVYSFPCWWCRSYCPEVILSESSVLTGCCVRDSDNSYMIQSFSFSSFFV